MNDCGCCEGIEAITPLPTANRSGLSAIHYRVGTHSTVLKTMLARLSSRHYPELQGLKTRLSDDPTIALLDAWATVADVLSFYQERIANEGYLRTATERRSILELGKLVGYRLRPGVAASVYLAFSLEDKQTVTIAPGNRVQSLPGPGELPQSFETAEPLLARAAWNQLKPRLTRPARLSLDPANQAIKSHDPDRLYFQGIATNLKPNDRLLFVATGDDEQTVLRRVEKVTVQTAENRTEVLLQASPEAEPMRRASRSTARNGSDSNGRPCRGTAIAALDALVAPLSRAPSLPPASAVRLPRQLDRAFTCDSDSATRLLTALQPQLKSTLYSAWRSLTVPHSFSQPEVSVYAFRTQASVFGHNAPKRRVFRRGEEEPIETEWTFEGSTSTPTEPFSIEVNFSPPSGPEEGPVVVRAIADLTDWTMTTTISIRDGSRVLVLRDSNRLLPLAEQSFTLEEPGVERVSVSVAAPPDPPNSFVFGFQNRPIAVTLRLTDDRFQISSHSGDTRHSVEIIDTAQSTAPLSLTISGEVRQRSQPSEDGQVIWLDAPYEQIVPNGWVIIERPDALDNDGAAIEQTLIRKIAAVSHQSRQDYGIAAKSTRIDLNEGDWIDPSRDQFAVVRGTTVFAQSERLELAKEPIEQPIGAAIEQPDGENGNRQDNSIDDRSDTLAVTDRDRSSQPPADEIELEQLYDGLDAGRWLIISGERADLPNDASGAKASELVMVANVEQRIDPNLPGDQPHTVLKLSAPLAYAYKRHTVAVYGNVIKATHGETRQEVLGSGRALPFQSFVLQQSPLTYLPAPTPAGAASTLEVRVNQIRWHETDSFVGLQPSDRQFITQTDDQGKTTVIFGNGWQGARPPSGSENITATYRYGIGKVGNVKAEQISLLATRPLGVKSVINPLPATGGADPESRDQARRNLPLALMTLDRLVSTPDYADFARTFAGISKASATRLSDGSRQTVHLTIAGVDDSPIEVHSELYRNFLLALQRSGDPHLPVRVESREQLVLVISANVKLLPDYLWESVAPQLRAALLDRLSFERRELGQPAYLSEVIHTAQQVPGVDYIDVDMFGGIPDQTTVAGQRRSLTPSEMVAAVQTLIATSQQTGPAPYVAANLARIENGTIQAAQLAYLTPSVPETLILNLL